MPDQPLCVPEATGLHSAGTCLCRDNITGNECDQCEAGFRAFNDSAGVSEGPCEGEIEIHSICECVSVL